MKTVVTTSSKYLLINIQEDKKHHYVPRYLLKIVKDSRGKSDNNSERIQTSFFL